MKLLHYFMKFLLNKFVGRRHSIVAVVCCVLLVVLFLLCLSVNSEDPQRMVLLRDSSADPSPIPSPIPTPSRKLRSFCHMRPRHTPES